MSDNVIVMEAMAGYNKVGQSLGIMTRKPYFNNIGTKTKCCSSPQTKKRCLRCNTLYTDKDNSPTACSFHGHITGERGLFAMAPPHQGIDGEWSDKSGVIVYKWNHASNRPHSGLTNWRKSWSCCAEYGEDSPPCRRGPHISYDDGHTLY